MISYAQTYQDGFHYSSALQQWRSDSAQTDRREVPGSNPGHTCRPSRSEFSVVFSDIRVDIG